MFGKKALLIKYLLEKQTNDHFFYKVEMNNFLHQQLFLRFAERKN